MPGQLNPTKAMHLRSVAELSDRIKEQKKVVAKVRSKLAGSKSVFLRNQYAAEVAAEVKKLEEFVKYREHHRAQAKAHK